MKGELKMKKNASFLGVFLLVALVVDWLRCRLHIARIEGWKEGIALALSSDKKEEA
jgi:hypothetical protein